MPRSKDEFFEEFKYKLAGYLAFGCDPNVGPMSRAQRVFDIPQLTLNFLKEIYEYLSRGETQDINRRIEAEAKAESLEQELVKWRAAMTYEQLVALGSKIPLPGAPPASPPAYRQPQQPPASPSQLRKNP